MSIWVPTRERVKLNPAHLTIKLNGGGLIHLTHKHFFTNLKFVFNNYFATPNYIGS